MKGHAAPAGTWAGRACRATHGPERGFSLIEAIVATVIATIAVMGLAYSFGNARGLVNRYEVARVALAAAQRRMEMLSVLKANDPLLSGTHQEDVAAGTNVVHVSWTATAYTDPASGSSPGHADLKQVVVTATWSGAAADDSLRLARLFPAQ
jgi:type II secretory pathway pseudopilin PulG